jgi:hypothetical protein
LAEELEVITLVPEMGPTITELEPLLDVKLVTKELALLKVMLGVYVTEAVEDSDETGPPVSVMAELCSSVHEVLELTLVTLADSVGPPVDVEVPLMGELSVVAVIGLLLEDSGDVPVGPTLDVELLVGYVGVADAELSAVDVTDSAELEERVGDSVGPVVDELSDVEDVSEAEEDEPLVGEFAVVAVTEAE